MSHYDTLGVAADASAAEIKAAWRRASAGSHPDREGGSTERMQAVNQAYEVLGDPQRRAHYDATGDSVAVTPIEDEARTLLVGMLNTILDVDDILSTANDAVATVRAGIKNRLQTTDASIGKLRRRLGKVRAKEGENLVDQLITARIRQLEEEKAVLERTMLVNAEVKRLLDNFEGESNATPPSQLNSIAALVGGSNVGGTMGRGWFSWKGN